MEGQSRADAAQQLGWRQGTLSSRLAQAKERLKQRLARGGVTLSALLGLTALSGGVVSAAVPAGLVDSTRRAVQLFLAGQVAGDAAMLAEGVLQAMFMTKMKVALSLAWVLSFLVVGTGLVAPHELPIEPGEARREDPIRPILGKPEIERLLEKEAGPDPSPERLRSWRAVEVLEAIGTPAARQVQRDLAQGTPAAVLTRQAQAAEERLARRPGGTP